MGAEVPTLRIVSTVIRGDDAKLMLRGFPKTASSRRTLQLPQGTVDTLLRRQVEQSGPNPMNLVFPSGVGAVRHPNNVRTQLRAAKARLKQPDRHFHQLRKSVATLIDQQMDTEAAASHLGHSGVRVTQDHYIKKSHLGPDARDILNDLVTAPGNRCQVQSGE